MSKESVAVNGYLATLARMEPELHMVDRDAALTSIAISLKRIADSLEGTEFPERVHHAIFSALETALFNDRSRR